MITYKEEFLNNFKKEKVFDSSSFSVLVKSLKSTKFISNNISIKETEFLSDAAFALNIILAIIRKPHISIKQEDIIVRSESATYLNDFNIRDTINDSLLWKRKGNNFKPEYVHTNEYNETLVLYENIIICNVLDFIKKEIESLMKSNEKKIASLESYFGHAGVSFAPFSLMSQLNTNDYIEDILVEDKEVLERDFDRYNLLLKKCNKLRLSFFYNQVSRSSATRKDLIMTNIFANDRRYNVVFKFYKKYISSNANKDKLERIYQDYCFLRLVKALESSKALKCKSGKNVISTSNDHLVLEEPIVYENNKFIVSINKNDSCGFDLNVLNKISKQTCKYYIASLLDINEYNHHKLLTLIDDKILEGYNDAFAFTLNNTSRSQRRIVEINFSSDTDKDLVNFISSFMLIFKTNSDLYETVCPICGKKKIKEVEAGYECITCHGQYSSFNEKDQTLVWIHRLGDVK